MNEEEMKLTIWLQQKTIEAKSMTIDTLEDWLKDKDERIAFLEDCLKDKDEEIERLRLQVRANEFNRLFAFGTGKA